VGTGRRAAGAFLPGRAQVRPCIAPVADVLSAQGPGRKAPTSRLDIVQIIQINGFDWYEQVGNKLKVIYRLVTLCLSHESALDAAGTYAAAWSGVG